MADNPYAQFAPGGGVATAPANPYDQFAGNPYERFKSPVASAAPDTQTAGADNKDQPDLSGGVLGAIKKAYQDIKQNHEDTVNSQQYLHGSIGFGTPDAPTIQDDKRFQALTEGAKQMVLDELHPNSTASAAFGRGFERSLPGATESVAAMGAVQPLLQPLDQFGTAGRLAHVGGTIIAAALGPLAGNKLLPQVPDNAQQAQINADETQHPVASQIGGMAANLPFFRPGFGGNGSLAKNIITPVASGVVGAAAQGAQEIASGMPSGALQRVLIAGGGNALLGKPTGLGLALTGGSAVPASLSEEAELAGKTGNAVKATVAANDIALKGSEPRPGEPPAVNEPYVQPLKPAEVEALKTQVQAHEELQKTALPTPKATPTQANIEKLLGVGDDASIPKAIKSQEIQAAFDAVDRMHQEEDAIRAKTSLPIKAELAMGGVGKFGSEEHAPEIPNESVTRTGGITPTNQPGEQLSGKMPELATKSGAGEVATALNPESNKGSIDPNKDVVPIAQPVSKQAKSSPESGGINPALVFHLGAPVVGATVGYQFGDTPAEKMKNAVLGALIGSGSTLAGHAAMAVHAANPDMLDKITDTLNHWIVSQNGDAFDIPRPKNPLEQLTPKENAVPVTSTSPLNVRPASGNGEGVGVKDAINQGVAQARQIKPPIAPPTPQEVSVAKQQTEQYRNDVISQINQTFNRSQSSPSVDIASKQAIADHILRTTGVTVDQLKKVSEDKLPISVLEAVRDKTRMAEYVGRLDVKDRQAAFQAEKQVHVQDMATSRSDPMNPRPVQRTPGTRLSTNDAVAQQMGNKFNQARDFAESVGRALLHRDVVLDTLDGNQGYKGFLSRVFGGKVDLAYNSDQNLRADLKAPLRQAVKEYGLDKTNMERIGIWMVAQEPNGVQRLIDSGINPFHPAIVNGLTKGEQAYADAGRKVLDTEVLPRLQQVMHQEYNIGVTPVKNYFPFQRDYDLFHEQPKGLEQGIASGSETGMDQLVKGLQKDAFVPRQTTKTPQGMTIERTPDAKGAIRISADEVLDRHINAASHLITHQHDLRMLGEIARSPAFTAKYGALGQEYVMNFLDTVARDGAPANATYQSWMDYLRKNTSAAVLGLRMLSQAKHLPNAAIAASEIGPDYLAKGGAAAITKEGQEFIRKNFAEINQRFGGEQSIKELNETTGGMLPVLSPIIKQAQKLSFYPERLIDSGVAKSTVIGAYMKALADKGVDPSTYATHPLDPEAQRMALVTSRKVVTSPLNKDLPQAISRGSLTGGNMSLAKAAFQFQNTMLRQAGYLKHDIYDLGVKNADPKQFAAAMAGFLAMLAAETGIVRLNRNLTGSKESQKPDNNFYEDAALELTKRVPFAGNVVSAVNYGETGLPLIDTAVQTAKKSGDIIKGTGDYGQPLSDLQIKKDKIDVASGLLGGLAGIPGASTAAQIVKNKILSDTIPVPKPRLPRLIKGLPRP